MIVRIGTTIVDFGYTWMSGTSCYFVLKVEGNARILDICFSFLRVQLDDLKLLRLKS